MNLYVSRCCWAKKELCHSCTKTTYQKTIELQKASNQEQKIVKKRLKPTYFWGPGGVPLSLPLSLSLSIYIYIYRYRYIDMFIYIYTYFYAWDIGQLSFPGHVGQRLTTCINPVILSTCPQREISIRASASIWAWISCWCISINMIPMCLHL